MANVHDEHDWMAALDWSNHGPKSRRFNSEHSFLAVVLSQIAELATGEYASDIPFFLAEAKRQPIGRFVPAGDAFGPSGAPTTLYAPALPAALEHSLCFRVPISDPNAITRGEWEAIEDAGLWEMSCGEGARSIWSQLAPLFAKLASDGRVRTWVEPVNGGGAPVALDRSRWRLPPDAAVKRCASCGIDPDDPFNPDAVPTHFIYVDNHDLPAVIEEAAHENYLARIEPNELLMRLIDEKNPTAKLKRRFLSEVLLGADHVLSHDDMIEQLRTHFGVQTGEREIVALKKAVLEQHPELRIDYARTGPRRKTRSTLP